MSSKSDLRHEEKVKAQNKNHNRQERKAQLRNEANKRIADINDSALTQKRAVWDWFHKQIRTI